MKWSSLDANPPGGSIPGDCHFTLSNRPKNSSLTKGTFLKRFELFLENRSTSWPFVSFKISLSCVSLTTLLQSREQYLLTCFPLLRVCRDKLAQLILFKYLNIVANVACTGTLDYNTGSRLIRQATCSYTQRSYVRNGVYCLSRTPPRFLTQHLAFSNYLKKRN